ncbi:MAG: hypothetical protein LUH05_07535 [Candidatus Gastranaerophilales bacterium]|nr:hypothetical protein [Candidatus Gastranaerophilales bacterium]
MLNKLGFKKKVHVGISLSSNNLLELVCVDKYTKLVNKYVYGNVKYNNAIREIIDFDEFEEVIGNLFEEAGLNPADCIVTLSLPNVYFGITPLDGSTEISYIMDNLQSEIEDLYLFKRNEPAYSYSILDSDNGNKQKNIVYSVVQAKVMAKVIDIFDKLEIDLVRIDTSISSMLRTIQYCDRFNKYVNKDEKTSILLITSNSCSSFLLNGPIITGYTEEPLAIKSFSMEEVYATIAKIAENAVSKNNANSLLVISETDEISAEVISQNLNLQVNIDHFTKNMSVSDPFIDVSDFSTDIDTNELSFMSIEAVGAAVADFDEYPLNINFLPPERVNENIIEVNGYEVDFYHFLIVIFSVAIVSAAIISILVCSILKLQTDAMAKTNTKATQDIQVFKKNISEREQQRKQDILPILTKILETNKTVVDVYTALSTDIPDSIYIKKFVTNSAGGIGILGESKSSESVQEFVKGLREKNPDLMLSKLSLNTKDDPVPAKIQNGFTFEIKTANTNVLLEDDTLTMIQNELMQASKKMPSSGRNGRNSSSMLPPPSPLI